MCKRSALYSFCRRRPTSWVSTPVIGSERQTAIMRVHTLSSKDAGYSVISSSCSTELLLPARARFLVAALRAACGSAAAAAAAGAGLRDAGRFRPVLRALVGLLSLLCCAEAGTGCEAGTGAVLGTGTAAGCAYRCLLGLCSMIYKERRNLDWVCGGCGEVPIGALSSVEEVIQVRPDGTRWWIFIQSFSAELR